MKQEIREVIGSAASAIVSSINIGKEIIDLAGLYVDDALLEELQQKAKKMNKAQFKSYLARRRLLEFYNELEPYCKD